MFKVGKHAVLRLIEETAAACEDWHAKHFQNLSVKRLEVDEQWAYVHTHKERITPEQKAENSDRGDCWLWAGIDPDSKAIITWRTGKRGHAIARGFARDLANRITGRVPASALTSLRVTARRSSPPSGIGLIMPMRKNNSKPSALKALSS